MGFARKIQRKQYAQQKKAIEKIARYKKRYWYVRSITHTVDDTTYTIKQDKDYSITLSSEDGIIGTTKASFGLPDQLLKDFVEHFHKLHLERSEKQNEDGALPDIEAVEHSDNQEMTDDLKKKVES